MSRKVTLTFNEYPKNEPKRFGDYIVHSTDCDGFYSNAWWWDGVFYFYEDRESIMTRIIEWAHYPEED